MKSKNGNIIMQMEGEDYPFPSFPRGHILFGKLSKLKHEIKNQIFNESWWALEDGDTKEEVIENIKNKLYNEIPKYFEPLQYDIIPPKCMSPAVKEIHRAWTKISGASVLRDYLCFILQEDDAYRFRMQWLVEWFGWAGWLVKINPVYFFDKSLKMIEYAESISDMKERVRLLRRILMLVLNDKTIRNKFIKLFREIKWNRVKLTEGDKYHFRGKYFKVDYKLFDY
jgi:hypothetical protein